MKSKPGPKRLVIGAMTGTSLDGIDVATAMIQGRGLRMRAKLLRHVTVDLGPLRDELTALEEAERQLLHGQDEIRHQCRQALLAMA